MPTRRPERHPAARARAALLPAALVVASALLATPGIAAAGDASPVSPELPEDPLPGCLETASAPLPGAVREALATIDGVPRQLLALRSYLRVRDIDARWSWTQEEIDAYERSPEHAHVLAEIERVRARFSGLNPGYALFVNTRVRSLDEQVGKWNSNASVSTAADALEAPAREACGRSRDGFATWLRGWSPPAPANLAAPGLSAHGQARAFDFQVQSDSGELVAGTDSRRIDADWIEAGWADRLAEAMSACPAFQGPLASPREPWHYAYVPPAADAPGGP